MARVYEFTFYGPPGTEPLVVRGQGNTIRSAERSARHRLQRLHGVDPTKWDGSSPIFIPKDER